MAAPSATDEKLAERIDGLAERVTELRTDYAGFRASVETELKLIRKLGDRLLSVGIGIIGTMIIGAATIAWAASAVVSDVRHQGDRIDKIEARLDAMGKQLDTLISRTAPAAAPVPAPSAEPKKPISGGA